MKSSPNTQAPLAVRSAHGLRLRPRISTLTYCVGIALAQWSAVALADSAVGQNTTLGNASNPAPINPAAIESGGLRDPEGMGTREPVAHTPSGQPYNFPFALGDAPTGKVPVTSGSVELGLRGVSGDKDSALYRMYKDERNGGVLGFTLSRENPADASYLEAVGRNLGRQDQFMGANFGIYNDWKASVFYNETVHVFTTTAYPLLSGTGTGNLTLPSNIPPAAGATFLGYYPTVNAATGACSGNVTQTPGVAGTTACFKTPLIGSNSTPYSQPAVNKAAGLAIAANQSYQNPSTLLLVRKNGGATFEKKITDNWKVFTSATTEKRTGARPFGTTQGGGGGTAPLEIAEPISYDTHDFKVGTRYTDRQTSFNLMANANIFRNNISTLNFQNPYLVAATPAGTLVQNGAFDLYPNNNYFNVKGEFARNFPEFYKSRVTATASFSTMRQNDQLQAPSANGGTAGTLGSANYVDLNLWTTAKSLSQQTANARIDTKLIDVGYGLKPREDLDIKAKIRYYETDNMTNYIACNPAMTSATAIAGLANPAYLNAASGCAGAWGRLINDGGGSALITATSATNGTPNSNNIIRNIPYENKQTIMGLAADYRVNSDSSFNLSFDRENMNRAYRERANVWENKLKLGYVNRNLGGAVLRISGEASVRRGDPYDVSGAYYQFLGVALPAYGAATSVTAANYVLKLANLRKFDLADRNQAILNARINYPVRENLDLGLAGQIKNANYPDSTAGKSGQNQKSLSLDLTYNHSASRVITGFAAYQAATMNQSNVYPGAGTGTACTLGANINGTVVTASNAQVVCGTAGNNSSFNPLNAWTESTRDTNNTLGLMWEEVFGNNYRFSVNYQYGSGKTGINYGYTPGATAQLPAVAAAAAVGNSTDMSFKSNALELALTMPIQKQLTARIMVRHEAGLIYDYHYAGLTPANLVLWGAAAAGGGPITPTGTVMDTGPQSYHVNTVLATLTYRF